MTSAVQTRYFSEPARQRVLGLVSLAALVFAAYEMIWLFPMARLRPRGIVWVRKRAIDVRTGEVIYTIPVDRRAFRLILRDHPETRKRQEYWQPFSTFETVSRNGKWALVVYFYGKCSKDRWQYAVFEVRPTFLNRSGESFRIKVTGPITPSPSVNDEGDKVAFVKNRTELWVLDLRKGTCRRIVSLSGVAQGLPDEWGIWWVHRKQLLLSNEVGFAAEVDLENCTWRFLGNTRTIVYIPRRGFINDMGKLLLSFGEPLKGYPVVPWRLKALILRRLKRYNPPSVVVSPCLNWICYQGRASLTLIGPDRSPLVVENIYGFSEELLYSAPRPATWVLWKGESRR